MAKKVIIEITLSTVYVNLFRYRAMLDFNNEYYAKDFDSNYKFIENAVKKFREEKMNPKEINEFVLSAIDAHNKNYL